MSRKNGVFANQSASDEPQNGESENGRMGQRLESRRFADSPFRRFVIRVRLYLLTENGFLPRNRA